MGKSLCNNLPFLWRIVRNIPLSKFIKMVSHFGAINRLFDIRMLLASFLNSLSLPENLLFKKELNLFETSKV